MDPAVPSLDRREDEFSCSASHSNWINNAADIFGIKKRGIGRPQEVAADHVRYFYLWKTGIGPPSAPSLLFLIQSSATASFGARESGYRKICAAGRHVGSAWSVIVEHCPPPAHSRSNNRERDPRSPNPFLVWLCHSHFCGGRRGTTYANEKAGYIRSTSYLIFSQPQEFAKLRSSEIPQERECGCAG